MLPSPESKEVSVSLRKEQDDSYVIHVGPGLLGDLSSRLAPLSLPRRVAIVSDKTVWSHYGAALKQALEDAGFQVAAEAVVEPGEQHKTRETKGWIEDQLLAARLGRDTWIAALGGGVVGDMAGFTAATYLRGVPFVQFPTTLLAMVDSSVGGKTGLDTPAGKNLIGAFWQPRSVIADIATLQSLPDDQYQSGLAEVIKHAVIADEALFAFLVAHWEAVSRRDADVLLDVVAWNCRIKASVVEADERESNLRKILNFGHTLGHALETAADYSLLHGVCVALGMRYEGRLAVQLGLWPAADAKAVEELLDVAGFPRTDAVDVPAASLVALTHQDKKARQGHVEYVFPAAIGTMHATPEGYGVRVEDQDVQECLRGLRRR